MFAVVDYVSGTSNLNYVDKRRIGATGHSAGGNAALRGASHFGREAKKTGQPSKLNSVLRIRLCADHDRSSSPERAMQCGD